MPLRDAIASVITVLKTMVINIISICQTTIRCSDICNLPYFHDNNARGMCDFTDRAPIMRVIFVCAV